MNTRLPALLMLFLACQTPEPTPDQAEELTPTLAPIRLSGVDYSPGTPSDLTLSETAQRHLLAAARNACDGKEPLNGLPELNEVKRPVIAVLYDPDGTRAVSQRIDGEEPILEKLQTHLPTLCGDAKESARTEGTLHILVVGYTARMPNFGIKGIFDYKIFEPQVTGIAYEINGNRIEVDPLEQLERNLGPKGVRTLLAKRAGLRASKVPAMNDLTIEVYRTLHIGEALTNRSFVQFHRGHSRLDPQDVTHDLLEQRLELIGGWYSHNVIDGEVTYEYSPRRQRFHNDGRTMVRSTMAVWILNRLAQYLSDDELSTLGKATIDTYLLNYFQMADSLKANAIQPSPIPLKNGNLVRNRWTTASFIAAAILERPDWETQAKEVDLLMRFAMSYKRDDGVMWTEFGSSQFFMPGQLLLAVAYAWEKTSDERYRVFFDEVLQTYAEPLLQMMHMGPKTWAPYAPAWITQPTARMYALTGEARYRDLVYAINDRVVLNYDRNAAYQVYGDYDGMLAPKVGSYGNNSVTAAALESLVDAAIVAKKDGDTARFLRYRVAIRHAVAFLLRLQFTPENTYYLPKRDQIIGGFKRDMLDSTSWMDNVWHLTSAFIKIQESQLFTDLPPESQ